MAGLHRPTYLRSFSKQWLSATRCRRRQAASHRVPHYPTFLKPLVHASLLFTIGCSTPTAASGGVQDDEGERQETRGGFPGTGMRAAALYIVSRWQAGAAMRASTGFSSDICTCWVLDLPACSLTTMSSVSAGGEFCGGNMC